MRLFWREIFSRDYVERHYRLIVFALVLVNTALIVFLIVYIWTWGTGGELRRALDRAGSVQAGPEAPRQATVVEETLLAWSKPGGVAEGAASRGVLRRGKTVVLLDSAEATGGLWYRIQWESRTGWVPAGGVRFIHFE